MTGFGGTRVDSDDTLRRMMQDYTFFAKMCLKVRNKSGQIVPLILNPAQQELHRRIEEHRVRRNGIVRILGLKGRQQGFSTYAGGRFYWRTSLRRGVNTFILTHEQAATDALFGIVDRYQRNNPMPPHVGAANAKELAFDLLDSSYTVATAGAKAAGRGKTISLFHGSEVAFWANAATHFAASVQAVPMEPGTEVILESTSNGTGGEWYERCQDAVAGRGDYELVFIPWFMSPEYYREPEPNFELDPIAADGEMAETEYAETFGLSNGQMAWRRAKIAELRSPQLFMQEYPATVQESFQAAGHEPFIKPLSVLRARKRDTRGDQSPLILGVDPAGMGGDRFAIAARRGPQVLWVRFRTRTDPLEGIEWVISVIDECNPARVNIDMGERGSTMYAAIRARGPKYANVIRPVNFGGTSQAKLARPKAPGPKNRRAEMWDRVREWLDSEENCSLPDEDAIQADLCAPKMLPQLNGDFMLESKKDLKARGVRSADLGDAIALTFASNEFLTGTAALPILPKFGDVTPEPSPYTNAPGGFESFGSGGFSSGGGWMR